MKQKKQNALTVLLGYAGSHRRLTVLGLGLSAVSMVCSMIPYLCIWLAARDLIAVAPDWTQARSVTDYGWIAFAFAVGGILIYFLGLMCTHLAAFRTAANIRKQGMAHVMQAPLGYFDANASGLIRSRLDAAAADTETLLAHNLADIVGTVTLFIAMLVLMFVFDWRMGAACLLAAVISILAMCSMMGGKNAALMAEYQAAQDRMTKSGTEYVRGIPVVKIFQQTVYSFKAFQQAIEEYSAKAEHYQGDICRVPQSINLTFTEGAFLFLVPVVLFLAPGALASGDYAGFVTNFAFYAVFSAIISTALAKIMFAASGMMLADTALGRIQPVMDAPTLAVPEHPQTPKGQSGGLPGCEFYLRRRAVPRPVPCLLHRRTRRDGSSGRAFGRRQDHCRQPDPPVLGCGHRHGGGGRRGCAPDRSPCADGAGGVRIPEQPAVQGQHSGKCPGRPPRCQPGAGAGRPGGCSVRRHSGKAAPGLDTVIGTEGTYLSGGEAQRIALAGAILKDAPIVVLDEATAFADPENEALIQKAFARLTKDRTVIMIAHRLSTVVGADKILVLEGGRVTEQGTHGELIAAGGLYTRMWADYNQAIQWKMESGKEGK